MSDKIRVDVAVHYRKTCEPFRPRLYPSGKGYCVVIHLDAAMLFLHDLDSIDRLTQALTEMRAQWTQEEGR